MSNSKLHGSSFSRSLPLTVGKSYLYGWHRMDRKGQRCLLEIIGGKNSVQVRFDDGFQAITSGNALKEMPQGWRPDEQPRLW